MTQKIDLKMGREAWVLIITLSVLWGGSFFFAAYAVREVPPLTLVFARVSLAAIALIGFAYLTGLRLPSDLKSWRSYFIMGVLNNCIPFSLVFWGQIYIASGLAAIFNATMPLFTVLLAHFLINDEKLTFVRLFGVASGVAGVTIMIGPDLLATIGDYAIAQLAILAAALSYGFASIFGRRFSSQPPVITAAGQLSASTIILAPIVIYLEPLSSQSLPSVSVSAAVVALALLSTALAYVFYFRILKLAGATNVSLVTFLIPVSAIALGVVVLDEQIKFIHVAGMMFIALGLIAIDGRLFSWIKKII
jgi:drug/metabolite transporter (DMT)-like permease